MNKYRIQTMHHEDGHPDRLYAQYLQDADTPLNALLTLRDKLGREHPLNAWLVFNKITEIDDTGEATQAWDVNGSHLTATEK